MIVSHILYPEPEDPENLLICMEIDRGRSLLSEMRSDKSSDQPKVRSHAIQLYV